MRNILLLIAGAAIFAVLIATKLDLPGFVSVVSQNISLAFYLLMCLLIVIQLLCRSLRFKILFGNLVENAHISVPDSFLLTSASFFVALATPNKSGDLFRALFYKNHRWEITAITFIEYFFDCLVVVAVPALGLFFVYRSYLTEIVTGYVAVFLVAIAVFISFRYFRLGDLLLKLPYARNNQSAIDLLKSNTRKGLTDSYTWFVGLLFACSSYGVYCLIFYFVLDRLGAQITLLETVVAAGIGFFVGSLTFIPMGIGSRDASVYGLLLSMGANSEVAMTSVVIMRSLSLALILVCGFCYFISLKRFKWSVAPKTVP